MNPHQQEWFWNTPEGERIYVKSLSPNDVPKAVIGIVHGMGEHSNRYFNLEPFLLKQGYAILAFDQIGHGKSSGKRGHVAHYRLLLDNIDRLILEAKTRFKGIPFILYGHSMGGNLVANYLLTRDVSYIRAGIISSPWLKLTYSPAIITIAIVRFLYRFFPGFTQNSKLNANAISRDSTYVQNYIQDPLVHTRISLAFFIHIFKAGLWNIKHANALKTKTLLYHGDADQITSYMASQEFDQNAKTTGLIQFHILPGFYHETHNDLGREKVYELIQQYLKNILNQTSS